MRIKRYIIMLSWLCFSSVVLASPSFHYSISGINNDALKNATARLDIASKLSGKSLSLDDIQHLYQKAPDEIKKAIQPFGYFKSSVQSNLRQHDDRYDAYYQVSPGPIVKVTRITLKIVGPGKTDRKLQKALTRYPIKVGDSFDSQLYEKNKQQLLELAQEHGYIRAKFTRSFADVYLTPYHVEITQILNTGPRFFFGNVIFNKTPLAESFLRRYLNFKPGQPFSYDKTLSLQETLNGSGYFKSGVVKTYDQHPKNRKIPIKISLKMRKRQQYLFGFGYGTNSGPRGTIGYNIYWINQYGHLFKSRLNLSQVNTSLSAEYLIPGKDPVREHFGLTGSIYELRPTTGESTVKNIGVISTRRFSDWQRTFGLNYEWENYKLNDNVPTRNSHVVYPSFTLSRLKANNLFNTRNGYSLSMNLIGSSSHALSTVSMFRAHLEYKQIFTLFDNNRFVLHGEYGYVVAHDMANRLPLSKYFYTGGIDTVRGYRYQDLGPGRFLIVGSAEYQYRIYDDWYAATFYDIGNAVNHINERLNRSVGVGVVWQTRIGALKMYVARALDRRDRPLSFMFSFGPDL